jgi:hypothetical protein
VKFSYVNTSNTTLSGHSKLSKSVALLSLLQSFVISRWWCLSWTLSVWCQNLYLFPQHEETSANCRVNEPNALEYVRYQLPATNKKSVLGSERCSLLTVHMFLFLQREFSHSWGQTCDIFFMNNYIKEKILWRKLQYFAQWVPNNCFQMVCNEI